MKIIKEIIINTIQEYLNEQQHVNKTFLCVDIQPEYKNYITFNIYEWVEYINNNIDNNNIVLLYNGYDSLGMITEYDYVEWLYNIGMEKNTIDNLIFYDKGYVFFRYCIDNQIEEDIIVSLVRYMIKNDITDSRDINKPLWEKYIKENTNLNTNEIRELLDMAGDMIYIPDLVDELKKYNNIVLMGGGKDECLKEVEIALKAINKPYQKENRFIY